MLWDAIRSYVQLATGVTEATTDKAKEVAQDLLSAVGITNSNEVAAQVSGMAEEVLNAARYQRDSFVNLVREEVTTVIESSGVAKAADLDALTSRLTRLAADVEALVSQLPGGALTPAGARTRRRAEAGEAPVEAYVGGAVGSDDEQVAADGQAPAKARAARAATPRKKAAAASGTRTGSRKTAPAKRTTAKKTAAATTSESGAASADGSPRKTASARKSADKAASPRKTASARKSSDKATSPRKTASARKSTARTTTEPSGSEAPETTSAEQAAAGSDNG